MSSSDGSYGHVDVEESMRQELRKTYMRIEWDEHCGGIFAHVDSFIELSKGNISVKRVYLDPYWDMNRIRRSDTKWEEKLGRALGNLQSLNELQFGHSHLGIEQEPSNWESVARVLRHIRQKITLIVHFLPMDGSAFAGTIRGHPTIQRFETGDTFQLESFGILASALATMPALESLLLRHALFENEEYEPPENHPAVEHPEHITMLLLSLSLRSVEFRHFRFQNLLCQAVALALKTGSPITYLDLDECNFSDGGGGAIVHALQKNSTLKTLRVAHTLLGDGIYDALTSILLVNTTLTDLIVCSQSGSSTSLHPFFVALRMNT
jgi:hypothetical protein